MTSVPLYTNPASAAVLQVSDFKAAGMNVLEVVEDRYKLVQRVVQDASDVLVCTRSETDETHGADDGFFSISRLIAESAPCAVLVFTHDESAERIVHATASGVHAYVVNGYARARLPSLARAAHHRMQRIAQRTLERISGQAPIHLHVPDRWLNRWLNRTAPVDHRLQGSRDAPLLP